MFLFNFQLIWSNQGWKAAAVNSLGKSPLWTRRKINKCASLPRKSPKVYFPLIWLYLAYFKMCLLSLWLSSECSLLLNISPYLGHDTPSKNLAVAKYDAATLMCTPLDDHFFGKYLLSTYYVWGTQVRSLWVTDELLTDFPKKREKLVLECLHTDHSNGV